MRIRSNIMFEEPKTELGLNVPRVFAATVGIGFFFIACVNGWGFFVWIGFVASLILRGIVLDKKRFALIE